MDVYVLIKHYEALPILIDYVKDQAMSGDDEAKKTLVLWDKRRNKE